MSTNVGSIHYDLSLDTSKFNAASGKVKEQTNHMASGMETMSKIGIGAMVAVGAAISYALIKNLDNAISRIDTLNNFPKVMKNLGYSTDDSTAAIKKLEAGVKGLPTSLDTIASAMQNIAPSAKSLDEASNLALALNNALIAGGKPAAMQASAMEQFSQAISKGKPDMMEWRALATAMPGQLDQISQSLGYGKGEWQKMAEDVSTGKLSFDKVKGAIVSLNEKGLGQFPSFAEQAKNSAGGLQSAMANANTAITRGIAGVITAIGSTNIANAITKTGEVFEKVLKQIAIGITTFSNYLKNNEWAVYAFTAVIAGLAAAMLYSLAPAIGTALAGLASLVAFAAPFVAVALVIAGVAFLIKQNWEKVKPVVDIVVGAFNAFWTFIKPFRDFIADQFIKAWNDLKAAFERARQAIEPFMPQLKILGMILLAVVVIPILAVIAVFGVLVAGVVLVITFIARLVGWLAQLGAWFMQLSGMVSQAMNSFMGSIANGINNAVNWFASLPGRARGAIGNLGGLLYSAGVEIIQGFINGINNMFGRVRGTLTDLTNKIKSWKGPEQKDKTLLTGAGEMIIGGFIKGLENKYGAVKDSLSNFTQGLGAEVNLAGSVNYSPSGSAALLSGTGKSGIGMMSQTINIGTIEDRSDAQYIVDSINRSYELAEMGMTP